MKKIAPSRGRHENFYHYTTDVLPYIIGEECTDSYLMNELRCETPGHGYQVGVWKS
jgi:hypothetical protein